MTQAMTQAQTPRDTAIDHRLSKALEQLQSLKNLVIETPEFTDFVARAQGLMTRCGTDFDPGGFWLVGPSGVGKTHLMEHLMRLHPIYDDGYNRRVPILGVEISAVPTRLMLLRNLLRALGHPMANVTDSDHSFEILAAGLQTSRTQLIVLGELQHICESNRRATSRAVTDTLKQLYDRTRVPMLLMGTTDLSRAYDWDEQFSTRIPSIYSMNLFALDAQFAAVLSTLQQHLPIAVEPALTARPFIMPLHTITRGCFRTIRKLLTESVIIAIREGSEVLRPKHIEMARSQFNGRGS